MGSSTNKRKGFRPHEPHCWQKEAGSILTTVRRAADALGKIEDRHPEWHSPIAVAQVLLCRLEDLRVDVRRRASPAAVALELGEHSRAMQELEAINQIVRAARFQEAAQALHGICISRDRRHHRIATQIP